MKSVEHWLNSLGDREDLPFVIFCGIAGLLAVGIFAAMYGADLWERITGRIEAPRSHKSRR